MSKDKGIILDLNDIYEHRELKEKELHYYNAELKKLKLRMSIVARDIDLTQTIIDMIEQEKVVDIKQLVRKK
jgi:hypothetical protein